MEGFAFDGDRLVPWRDGDRERKALATVTVRLSAQFGRIFEGAGCGEVTFHDLRHEATSRLYEKTSLSDVEIAKITGHSSTKHPDALSQSTRQQSGCPSVVKKPSEIAYRLGLPIQWLMLDCALAEIAMRIRLNGGLCPRRLSV